MVILFLVMDQEIYNNLVFYINWWVICKTLMSSILFLFSKLCFECISFEFLSMLLGTLRASLLEIC